jgi:hypothetical protein
MNPHDEIEFAEAEIDFTQHIVIAVFEEVKGNGGWSIDIYERFGVCRQNHYNGKQLEKRRFDKRYYSTFPYYQNSANEEGC